MGIHRTLSSSTETTYKKTSSNLRKLINGILYVVTTGCTWQDVPHEYGSKSTVHRIHLYLCEYDTYQEIFNELFKQRL